MSSMGRRRGGRFADRPANVEIATRDGVTYFSYVFPDRQRKAIGSSEDAAAAYAKATALNGYFAQQRVDISTLMTPPKPRASAKNPTVATLIDEFKKHDQARAKHTERTREELDYRLNKYAETWKEKLVGEIQTIDIAKELNVLTDNAYVKHRAALKRLFQFACHQGYRPDNPVAVTVEREAGKKKRRRHTWPELQKVIKEAEKEPWLHRAIRIALYSLQRRTDVVKLHKVENQVDLEARTITVLQRKTRNYKNPVWIEIEMGAELLEAVRECVKSELLCPFLIHRKPSKLKASDREAKGHAFAVTAGYLSRAFSRVRDTCGAYAEMPEEERPTLHELRAFGAHLYKQAGYSKEYRMALSGHAKEETLEHYEKDHEEGKPRRVAAGLSAAQLPPY